MTEKNLDNPFEKTLQHEIFKDARVDFDMYEKDPDIDLELDLFEKNPFKVKLVDFLSSSSGVFGASGSGKSVTCARIMEQICKHRIPFTIFDKEGDFDSLLTFDIRIKVLCFKQDPASDDVEYFSKERSSKTEDGIRSSKSKPITIDGIKELAQENFYNGRMTVLDLSNMASRDSALNLVYAYVNQIKQLSDSLYTEGRKLHHILLLDEAHYFLPAMWADLYDRNIKILKPMVSLFSSIASLARKRGIVLILSSQRMSHVSYDTLANIKQFFFHRVSSPKDVKKYEDQLSNLFVEEWILQSVSTMTPGSCIYIIGDRVYLTKTKNRESHHLGSTPRPSDTYKTLKFLKSGTPDSNREVNSNDSTYSY